ncbi:MAG TPA: rhomboid family intramembrane serine protease [Bacteroidia bacterium]|nr:rhomboid family intramembrane serine protease [Bacteroidia bacterium]
MDQDNTNYSYEQPPPAPPRKHALWALIPKGDYFFTPIILNANILVFLAMVISGVSPVLPDAESFIRWGANCRPYTMGGEPWRLFTSMFLHFGIIHLATNMYALFSVGRMLEPFVGKWRFFILYLCAGLGGSSVSLWWHQSEMNVSAGASGAIFGIFGVFAALLTTNLIDQSIRKQLMRGMASAIGLNLLIGLYAGIDNSAHIGGLLTGALGGWLSYFDLKTWYHQRIKKYTGLIASVLITISGIIFFWMIIPPLATVVNVKNEPLLQHYDIEEKRSLDYIGKINSSTTAEEIEKNVLQPWQHNYAIVDSIKANGITKEGEASFRQIQLYTIYRLKGAEAIYRSVKEKREDLMDSAKAYMSAADNTIKEPVDTTK